MGTDLIDKMRAGDRESLMRGLNHPGAIYRMNAIAFVAITGVVDAEIESQIKSLRNDDVVLDGYSVSDFAFATLALTGVERYTGEREVVRRLIESRFDFLR